MKLEIDIFATMANGLNKRLGKSQILSLVKKQIRSLAVHIHLNAVETNRLYLNAVQNYNQVSKKYWAQARKLEKGKENETIYNIIRAKIQKNDLVHEANQIMYSYEQRHKHEQLYGQAGLLAMAKEEQSPFFACSSHAKPAKDHAPYQGKIYVDKYWEDYVPEELKASIRAYIQNRKIITVQDIAGAPVYLTTRRNCKHYFKNIPVKEVLHASPRRIIAKHGMYSSEPEAVSRKVLYYREYHDRVTVENELLNLIPNPKLEQDIKKDKKLLDKWKRQL